MKKALVYVNEIDGRAVGSVSMKMEASELDAWTHHHVSGGFAIKVAVPQALENIPESQLKGVLIPAVPEFWSKDGQVDVYVDPLDVTWTYHAEVPAFWEIQAGDNYVAFDKANRITEKYNLMNSDVLAQMATVFGTTNPDSANAYNETWKKMSSNPELYSGAGLTASFAVAGLAVGDALDTNQKVQDYANAKLAEVDAYGVARMVRIEQFRNEKASIEAE